MNTLPPPIRIAVADDEPLARQRIEDLLAGHPEALIVGTVGNGHAAVECITAEAPHLIFLDIQMPGLSGLEVVERIGPDRMPVTIFVTAFDQHALRAFELAAVDYLVKPFDDERFETAFQRAKRSVVLGHHEQDRLRLASLLQSDAAGDLTAPPPPRDAMKTWLASITVESRGEMRVIPVSKIQYITASGPYAELRVGGHLYLVRERMQNLEDSLDPERFLRIHRSSIVRLDLIESFLRHPGGDYAVRLVDGTELSVSRTRREEVERRMGLF